MMYDMKANLLYINRNYGNNSSRMPREHGKFSASMGKVPLTVK